MRAAAIDRFGGPEVLRIHELPVPHLNHDEVLIRLHTSGVGSWDAEMRAGWWPQGEPQFPLVLGTDGAGTVVAKGAHVRRFRDGDTVYAYSFANPKGGFYAQYVVVAAEKVAPTPAGLSLDKAGAIADDGAHRDSGYRRCAQDQERRNPDHPRRIGRRRNARNSIRKAARSAGACRRIRRGWSCARARPGGRYRHRWTDWRYCRRCTQICREGH